MALIRSQLESKSAPVSPECALGQACTHQMITVRDGVNSCTRADLWIEPCLCILAGMVMNDHYRHQNARSLADLAALRDRR